MSNAKIIIGTTGGQVNFSKVTTPDTPPAGYVAMYAENVSGTDTIRGMDSSGNIISFGGGTAGTNGTSGTNGSSGSSGSSGVSGTSGNGFDWEGPWSSLIAYFQNDTVFYNGSSWVATATIAPGGAAPDVNPDWDLVALANFWIIGQFRFVRYRWNIWCKWIFRQFWFLRFLRKFWFIRFIRFLR